MKKTTGTLAVFGLLLIAAAAYYFWQQSHAPGPRVLQPVVTPPPVAAPPAELPQAETHFPLPPTEEAAPAAAQLPPLQQSDTAMRNALADLFGSQRLMKLFHMDGIVRRFVVTVDNLPRKTAAARLWPVQPVDGAFRTGGGDDALVIAPENAARYTPYVEAAEMVNSKALVALYVKFYPLFQQAYQDLGYPNGYFNDRLVAVIDHLLEAPEIEGPVALTQPHILYQFADPALEDESAGHKMLLRMGNDNEERIKAKLREIRKQLTSGILKQDR